MNSIIMIAYLDKTVARQPFLPNACISMIILYMHPANERRRYIVTSSLIGWAHVQNDPLYVITAFCLCHMWH